MNCLRFVIEHKKSVPCEGKTEIDGFDLREEKERLYIQFCLYTGYKQIKEIYSK